MVVPIALVTGPANSGKAAVALADVRRHVAQGREPLLVLPTRADVEHYLRELVGAGTAMGVRVERFGGLVELVARRAALSEPPLGALAREHVVAALLAGADAGDRDSLTGLTRALAELFAELGTRRLTPPRLAAAFARWEQTQRLEGPVAELPRLYAGYTATLQRLGRLDAEQRTMRALDELRRRPSLWGGQPVVLYGFDDLTTLQLDVIETLGRVVGADVTVTLTYEPGRAAFAGRASTYHALAPLACERRVLAARADHYAPEARAALSHVERHLFEPGAPCLPPSPALQLIEGGGERAELELVAAEVRRLREEGLAAEEIAVVLRAPWQRRELLAEVFAAVGVPVSVAARRRFADTAVGSGLIGLLRCAAEDSGAGLADLLAWLRAPGMLERPELADRLELAARRAGAGSAAAARSLWEQRNWPLETIDRVGELSSAALIERASRELERLFAAPRRGRGEVLSASAREEAAALAAGLRALAELRELAHEDASLAPRDAGALAQALARLELHAGAEHGAGRVAVVDPLELRARRVEALFLCCLQEGVFPAPARAQPLLAEEERRALAESSGLLLGAPVDALARERYLLYAAVSRPRRLLALSWHVADDDGEPRARSLFVDDVCDLFHESLQDTVARRALGAFAGAPQQVSTGLAAGQATVRPLADELLRAELSARPWSASSLETWLACPVRWFVERMLRPQELEPESEPLARGALAHAVLRDVLEGLRRETGSARLTPARLGRARELLAQTLEERRAERPPSAAPERVAAAARRLQADVERYLAFAAAQESPLEPRHLELSFGFEEEEKEEGEGDDSLPALALADGAVLRGRIDRVDVTATGQAVVYDYKSGKVLAPGRWLAEGNLQLPLYMHVVEELLGVEAVGGFYQPLSGEDLRPRGLLDVESGVELDCVRGDARDHADVRELLTAVLDRARAAAREAGAGALEPRPQTCSYGGRGCAYPSICRCER